MEKEKIKTMEEFINYICELIRHGVNVTGIIMEEQFYIKINTSVNILECETLMGIPVIISKRPSYTYKEDFHICYPHKE